MQSDRPTIEESISLGKERMRELIDIQSCAPEEFFLRLKGLSWIRIKETIDSTLTDRSGFDLVLLEFFNLFWDIVVNQRGPGIIGYVKHIELNFSPRFVASYDPVSRVVRLNMGVIFHANELEATYRWLDSLFFREVVAMSLEEIGRLEAPPAVQHEITAFLQAGEEGLPVSGKFGLEHPIGVTLLRFVIAHELAHLIYFAESPKLQASWRQTAWSDYDDALDYSLSVGWISDTIYNQFLRSSLPEHVATRWITEFVADGLGFYTVSRITPPQNIEPRLSYSVLQTAVEIFFHSFLALYRGDVGTHTHPPPILRCVTIRASQRKLHRVSWPEFLSKHWGPGLLTSQLLATIIRKIGGNP